LPYRLAIWDFDGTIVDTTVPITETARATLRAAGYGTPDAAAVRLLVGLPLGTMLDTLAGGGCAPDVVDAMVDDYRARWNAGTGRLPMRLFDGVRETVGRLHAHGVGLAIATSRGRASLDPILGLYGIAGRFRLALTDGCVARGKPHPEMLHRILDEFGARPGEALMIGDTVFDLRMGRAAGVDTCAVTWGFQPEEALRAEEPTHVVDHPSQLLPLFDALPPEAG